MRDVGYKLIARNFSMCQPTDVISADLSSYPISVLYTMLPTIGNL